MSSGIFFHQLGMTSGVARGTKFVPTNSRSAVKNETRSGRRNKKSRMGQAFLFHMLMQGSSTRGSSSRNDTTVHRAVVLENEQSPQPRAVTLNGVTDDWSVPQPTRDWDGNEISEPTKSLPAVAGLLAVAGAGYVCTQIVGVLMNRRSDLARIVPHPVAFSSASSSEATTPRSSLEGDPYPNLRSRPLSPDAMDRAASPISPSYKDRSTSPVRGHGMHRATSMTGLELHEQQTTDVEDDSASLTSAAEGVEVESAASSFESSDVDSLDTAVDQSVLDEKFADIARFRTITPEMLEQLPYEFTVGSLRERAQLAMRAASVATEAAQRASAFSAAASTAATTAANASRRAMSAASLAHIALESGNIEQMTTAQAEAWKAAQLAAEAERRAANAAVLATAYEDHAEQQAKVARELSLLPSGGFLRPLRRSIRGFLKPITTTVVNITTGIYQWIVGVWMYFASGTFWDQTCSFSMSCVSFIQGLFVGTYLAIRNAILYVISSISNFCGKAYTGTKNGVSSTFTFLKAFFSKLINPRGSIGGSTAA